MFSCRTSAQRMLVEFFIPGQTFLEQCLQMVRKIRLGLIGRESGALVHGVIPVWRPNAILLTSACVPVQHAGVKLQIEMRAKLTQYAFGIQQELTRVQHDWVLVTVCHFVKQLPLTLQARVRQRGPGQLNRKGRQHFPGVANEKYIARFTQEVEIQIAQMVRHVFDEKYA